MLLGQLPIHAGAAPVEVHLPRSRFPVAISFESPDTWAIAERIGEQLVSHGRLAYRTGRFVVRTAAGTTRYGHSWQGAVTQHLLRRG
ncbi:MULTISPECIES: hypothetical protein [unclassified Frigoribacterium]|jgi:hypothetical protein|uniref:hypothetical protein n=1 Tax=unclassified Frigoribacterium TaxID=2627005 RepID=UPI0006F99A1D|nr:MULTISPECIES: hypothetical protein [unclassified Frigoribacterium]KQS16423.1 hypothetical protein ASG05_11755 [Frigoribacterium sp. Leaf186]MBF4600548.1 hypothetical protein [Frigoribacterium sp. VKM Ac-1396]